MARRFATWEFAIVVVALTLRLAHLSSWSLNNDEIAEATWSSLPFAEMMKEVRRDAVHPPGDYLVQFVVGRIGPDWVRRLPSAIAGTATVAAVMLLARLVFGRVAGVAAGLLMAIAPSHIYYSQEVRPYSIAMLLFVLSLIALEMYGRSQSTRWAVAWSSLVFLAGATLYFGGLVAAAAGVVRMWRRLPIIVTVWTILYLPWLAVVCHAAGIPSPGARDRLDWSWWSVRLQALAAGNEKVYEAVSLGSWAFWLAVLIGAIVSLSNRSSRLIVVAFGVGTALEILVLQIHPHFSSIRYLAPAWPAAFVLAGAGVMWLWRFHWTAAIALLAVFTAFSAVKLDEYYRGERSDWGRLARYVHARVKPGERVIATNGWVFRNFGYHWRQMPSKDDVQYEHVQRRQEELRGPVWIVSGQCMPRETLQRVGVMMTSPQTEWAEIRYLRAHQSIRGNEELCPE